MYTNISTIEVLDIINMLCHNHGVEENIRQNITKLIKTTTDQNYFQFLETTYVQSDGLAMDATTSSILSEIYLQYLESSSIYNLLLHHNIVGYFRYVDDILVVYNEDTTNIDSLLLQFNNLSPKLEFTTEKEENQKINFLDITITRESEGFSIDIYRRSTYTDVIIPKGSCHHNEQKMAAIGYEYFHDRLHKYQLSPESREKESNTLQQILENNGYDDSTLRNLSNKNTANLENKSNKKQWVKFTYIGKERRAITKTFKNTSVNISLSTNNTLSNH